MRALTTSGAYKQIAYIDLRDTTIYSFQKEELNPVCIEDANLLQDMAARFKKENRHEETVEFYHLLKGMYSHDPIEM